jgi:tRNA (guanine37-N1)-methyltransferase
MRIDILTLFPEMFVGPFGEGMVKRAAERGLVELVLHNIRDYAHDRHRTVDDYPYGGGVGMVLKPEPIFEAVESVKEELCVLGDEDGKMQIILLTPQGRPFCQKIADELSRKSCLLLICGRYEGVDERVRQHLAADEISIGDYVLSGGELAAMVLVDAVVRLLPRVLGSEMSAKTDSHAESLLEYPQYTRPRIYRGWEVPPVLLSGNHEEVARWRREQSIERTLKRRPDLLEGTALSSDERHLMDEMRRAL